MFGRKKTYIALYEYTDEKGVHLDYQVMKKRKPPKSEEFILRRTVTSRILIFEAKVVYKRY